MAKKNTRCPIKTPHAAAIIFFSLFGFVPFQVNLEGHPRVNKEQIYFMREEKH